MKYISYPLTLINLPILSTLIFIKEIKTNLLKILLYWGIINLVLVLIILILLLVK